MDSTNLRNQKLLKTKRNPIDIHMPSAGSINTVQKTGRSKQQRQQMDEMKSKLHKSCDSNDESTSASSKKIEDLVKKTAEMKRDAPQKDKVMDEKFANLHERINNSVAFLRSTKNQIENIKFIYQKDMLNYANQRNYSECLRNSNQSIEELNRQMQDIQKKLASVREKAKKVKDNQNQTLNNQSFESTFAEAVDTLDKIGRGDYGGNNVDL